jgi:hypothetical protein
MQVSAVSEPSRPGRHVRRLSAKPHRLNQNKTHPFRWDRTITTTSGMLAVLFRFSLCVFGAQVAVVFVAWSGSRGRPVVVEERTSRRGRRQLFTSILLHQRKKKKEFFGTKRQIPSDCPSNPFYIKFRGGGPQERYVINRRDRVE